MGHLLVRSNRIEIALVHTGFVLTGVMTTLLGPILPTLSIRWSLNDAQSGYLFTAQFASSILGVALSSVLAYRYGYRITLMWGTVLLAIGVAILGPASWAIGLVGVGVYGTGLGLTIPTANMLVAKLNPERRAAALNQLNFSWGVGAVGCPFAVAGLQRGGHISLFGVGMAGLLALEALCLALADFRADSIRILKQAALPELGMLRPGLLKSRHVLVLGTLFFTYVGTEASIGGWVASYSRRVEPNSLTLWAMTPSFFWGALVLGRAFAPLLLTKIGEVTVARAGLATATLGVLILLTANALPAVVVGAGFAGLGLSAVFPITIAMLSRGFGEMASRVGGVMFALAGLGGAIMPWLVGAISTEFGSLKIGLVVPLLGGLTMLALYLGNGSPGLAADANVS